MNEEGRSGFARWSQAMLERLGFANAAVQVIQKDSVNRIDKEVIAEIEREGHGVIVLGRDKSQPWRERFLYEQRSKVIVLLGSNPHYARILVPVDLSETTLLVMMFLRQLYLGKPDFSFQFVHVLRKPSTATQKRWKELSAVVGFRKVPELMRITSHNDIAAELLRVMRESDCGTVIMGKRGLSGIKRWMPGSVSKGVLKGLDDQTLFLID